jgi:cytochrome c oxidase subunit II
VFGMALALVAGAGAGTGAAEISPPRTIKITAKKFEYSPAEVHLKRGEHVVLELTSLDRKHGFKLPELGIRADVPAGATARIEVTSEKAGRFPFACDVFCGDGHEDMTGTIVVDP